MKIMPPKNKARKANRWSSRFPASLLPLPLSFVKVDPGKETHTKSRKFAHEHA